MRMIRVQRADVFVMALGLLAVMASCARYGAGPTGGPKDLAPPILLSALPPEGDTVHDMNGPTEIVLNFDEYVVLSETDKIVTSPPLSKVSYTGNLKQVKVVIEDTLLRDRTYSINFNNAIGDLHESTPLQGYTYFFSTGSKVDSGRIDGIIKDAFTLAPVASASVMFYARKPEGYPVVSSPDYVAVTDTGGYFQCRYMAEGCYYLLVAAEESRDYRVDPTQEKMAYSSDCWQTQAYRPPVLFRKQPGMKESDSLMRKANDSLYRVERQQNYGDIGQSGRYLYAYQDKLDSVFLKESKFDKAGEITLNWYYALDYDSLHLEFLPAYSDMEMVRQWEMMQADTNQVEEGRRGRRNRPMEDMELPDLSWPSFLRYSFVPQSDPLVSKVYFNNMAVTGLRLVMDYKGFVDTAELMLPVSGGGKKTMADTVAFRLSMSPGSLFFQDSLLLDFNFPVIGEDWAKASLLEIATDEEGKKDTVVIPMEETRLERIYPNRYSLKYPWKPGLEYSFFIPSACFSDYFGRLVDTTFFTARVPALETYGQVGLRVQGVDTGFQYLIQMVTPGTGGRILHSAVLPEDGRMEYPYVNPSNISFVLVRDDNRNGRWDAGDYQKGLQPERRWFFPKNLQVEADWRMEESWSVK